MFRNYDVLWIVLISKLQYTSIIKKAYKTFQDAEGHGRLLDPPSRASMWRMGYDNPPDYNDNQGFCGGQDYQIAQGGKCGICG